MIRVECPRFPCDGGESSVIEREWTMGVCEEHRECSSCGGEFIVVYEPASTEAIGEIEWEASN